MLGCWVCGGWTLHGGAIYGGVGWGTTHGILWYICTVGYKV